MTTNDATMLSEREMPRSASSIQRRAVFILWLRKVHGWIGLWGALLGLLFGMTGILLNHRAVMKLPAAQVLETSLQLKLPQPAPESARALADWLQAELGTDAPANRVREEPPRPAPWGDKTIRQPAHWQAFFSSARTNLQAEYWVGNEFVTVRRGDANFLATLNNLHKGNGAGVGWVLLADTLGGAMMVLALTGVLLWTQLNRRRLIGTAIALVSVALTVTLAVQAL